MKKVRSERRLSLSEISKNTKIQSKYLEYLENGEYEKLPADVYVRGFLGSYAAYLGVNEKALAKLYEREKSIQRSIKKIDDRDNSVGPVKLSRFVITPKFFVIFFISIFVLAGFFYLYREASSLTAYPRLVIMEPSDGEIIEERITNVKGVTDKDAQAFINNQPVLVNDKGEFSENVELQEGVNVIIVKSKSKLDKESAQTITIQAVSKAPEENPPAEGEETGQ